MRTSLRPVDHLETKLVGNATRARLASRQLGPLTRAEKDAALDHIARLIEERQAEVMEANVRDLQAGKDAGLSAALMDRLALDEDRIAQIAESVREIARLDDPVGEVVNMRRRPNGMRVGQVRVPLGVIAMIYESRPNVTVDAAALCIKSGNAVLLRGGKEAKHSNFALGAIVRDGLSAANLSPEAVQIIEPLGREETKILMSLTGKIDLLIPRGGEGLIRFVAEHARVPVVQHFKGVCHLYVDENADVDMAFRLVENGKMQRPGVCNALECLLVHEDRAAALLPRLAELIDAGLEVRGDERCCALLQGAQMATDADWGAEHLARILSVRVVDDLDAGLAHIASYGSQHTESICTESHSRGQRFLREVDASCVMLNASTRFNDGGMLGLGAEVGISTTKLHAYGPMGVTSLTALKWMVQGEGQVR